MKGRAAATIPPLVAVLASACAPQSYQQALPDLREAGLARTDHDPEDAPFDAETLAGNFMKIAFGSEFWNAGADAVIVKWRAPVAYRLIGRADAIRGGVGDVAEKLSRSTGLPFREAAPGGENFILFFSDEASEKAALAFARERIKQQDWLSAFQRTYGAWKANPASPCIFFAKFAPEENLLHTGAVILRDGLDAESIRACLNEEMAQAMGLGNDDADVRPSVFNDDEEFLHLTKHDEYLLRILYDPRIMPGMKADAARPFAEEIARDLMREAPVTIN